MIARLRQRLRAGKLYEGPAAYTDDPQLAPRPGYYALDPSGKKLLKNVPLVCVDDAPDDHEDGACHYEYAGRFDYPQRKATGEEIRAHTFVDFEAHADGKADINA